MAGVAMSPLANEAVAAFRTAQELSGKDPAQWRRTIEELEARIAAQDELIERQLQYIQELEGKAESKKEAPKPKDKEPLKDDERLKLLERIDDLLKENRQLEDDKVVLESEQISLKTALNVAERRLEDMESELAAFSSDDLTENLIEALQALKDLPLTKERRNLEKIIRDQHQEVIISYRDGKISVFDKLSVTSNLIMKVLSHLATLPKAAEPMKVEAFRAEVLYNALQNGSKSINTPEAQKILCTHEKHKISHTQALRAMKRSAEYPDVIFDNPGAGKDHKARICLIREGGARS